MAYQLLPGGDRSAITARKPNGAMQQALVSAQRLQAAKQKIKDWTKKSRHLKGKQFVSALNRRLVGHYNYFGLRSNENGIGSFFRFAIGCAYKWLNRRGGKKKSFNWDQFRAAMTTLGVARPICYDRQREHKVPAQRRSVAKASTTEEPDTGNPHATFCANRW